MSEGGTYSGLRKVNKNRIPRRHSAIVWNIRGQRGKKRTRLEIGFGERSGGGRERGTDRHTDRQNENDSIQY